VERRLSDTALRPVPAAALAKMTGAQHPAVVRLTHEQLADLVGTAREITTKVLGDLQDRKLLCRKRGKIVIPDADRLAELAEDESGLSNIRTR
jgi:CRP/FNR family cyclic AMP-dependent transcriptional regulator